MNDVVSDDDSDYDQEGVYIEKCDIVDSICLENICDIRSIPSEILITKISSCDTPADAVVFIVPIRASNSC